MWHRGLPSPHNCGCVRGNASIESWSAEQRAEILGNNNQRSDLNLTLIHLNGTATGKRQARLQSGSEECKKRA